MDCRTKINPPCVINKVNYIRIIIDKWDWFTFLFKPLYNLGKSFFMCHFFLQKKHLNYFLIPPWGGISPLPFCLLLFMFFLSVATKILSLFSVVNFSSSWTHMVWSSMINHLSLRVFIRNLERSIFRWNRVQIIVHKEMIKHVNLKSLTLCC